MAGRVPLPGFPSLVSVGHRHDVSGMPAVSARDSLERAPVLDPTNAVPRIMNAMTTMSQSGRWLYRRAVGRRLHRAAQRNLLAAAVLALFVGPGAAAAAAQTTLAEVKSLRCTFTRQATGSWAKGDAPETAVRASSLILRFESIDTESGTALLRNGAMATDVTVRLAEGYLHLMQAFRTGPLYTRPFSPRAPPLGASRRRIPATNSSRHRCPAQPRALSRYLRNVRSGPVTLASSLRSSSHRGRRGLRPKSARREDREYLTEGQRCDFGGRITNLR